MLIAWGFGVFRRSLRPAVIDLGPTWIAEVLNAVVIRGLFVGKRATNRTVIDLFSLFKIPDDQVPMIISGFEQQWRCIPFPSEAW